MKMEFFATSNKIPVHISDSKNGDTVLVLLHGYLETLYIWEDFRSLLDSRIRTLAIDLPGHGLSGSFYENTMDRTASVIKDVLSICGVEKAYLAGHSMGGYAAIKFAESYPEQCSGVMLLNSNPFADSPEKINDREREMEIVRADKLVYLAQSSIPKMYSPDNLRKFDDKIQETIEICETHDPEGIVSSIKGLMKREDMSGFWKNCSMKTAMIFGDNDKFMPVEKAREIIEMFKNSKSYIIEGTGHNSFIEKAPEVAEIVNGFVE